METVETMQYVLVVEFPDEEHDGPVGIDNAASDVQDALNAFGLGHVTARPLSEIIAC